MAKRPNHSGSIYKDKARGRWVAALVVDHDPDGKPIRRRFTAKTRREVEQRLDDAKTALHHGLRVPDPTTTIEKFARWWVDEIVPHEGLAPATVRWYGEMVELVIAGVGTRTLTGPRALTPADVEHLCAKQRTSRTANAVQTTLSKMLRAAEARGLVGRNVARLAKRRGDDGKAREVKALTVEQVTVLLAELDDRWRTVALVGVTTGLRPQELLALHWPDVTLTGDEPRVSVRHALTWVGGPQLKAPKRLRSYRAVPLIPEAVDALKAWKRAQAAERLAAGPLWDTGWAGLMFTTEAGGPHPRAAYRRALAAAVPGVRPHMLRHTFCTHLLEGGAPIHHVAELAGDSVATIESNYSHVLRVKHEVAALARGLVGGAS